MRAQVRAISELISKPDKLTAWRPSCGLGLADVGNVLRVGCAVASDFACCRAIYVFIVDSFSHISNHRF